MHENKRLPGSRRPRLASVQAPYLASTTISPTFATLVVPNTQSGSFKPRKDQRKAINRWNRYVLGTEYARKVASLCPRSRQYVNALWLHFLLGEGAVVVILKAYLNREKKQLRTQPDLRERVHEAEYPNLPHPFDKKTRTKLEPAHRFEVNLEPDNLTEEKFALWQNYQEHVHHERPSENTRPGLKRFLCSGLGQQDRSEGDGTMKLGSYHQCYRVDGRLIAMGVLDLLPHCVSSVYLMYHSDYNDWGFGKLSAVREIMLAVERGYRYHYMGFYVQSCQKMRYKADFKPSYLLDSITYSWNPLNEDMLCRLSCRNFVSMHIEQMLEVPSKPQDRDQWLADSSKADIVERSIEVGNVRYTKAATYIKGESHDSEYDPATKSAFKAGMPGILAAEGFEREVDLGQWRLRLRGFEVQLEDLESWTGANYLESHTLEGVTAELAASIGGDLVKRTALSFSP